MSPRGVPNHERWATGAAVYPAGRQWSPPGARQWPTGPGRQPASKRSELTPVGPDRIGLRSSPEGSSEGQKCCTSLRPSFTDGLGAKPAGIAGAEERPALSRALPVERHSELVVSGQTGVRREAAVQTTHCGLGCWRCDIAVTSCGVGGDERLPRLDREPALQPPKELQGAHGQNPPRSILNDVPAHVLPDRNPGCLSARTDQRGSCAGRARGSCLCRLGSFLGLGIASTFGRILALLGCRSARGPGAIAGRAALLWPAAHSSSAAWPPATEQPSALAAAESAVPWPPRRWPR